MLRRTSAEQPRRRWARQRLVGAFTAAILAPVWMVLTASPAQAVPSLCDVPGVAKACDIYQGADTALDFASDPFAFIAKKMGEGAKWLLAKIVDQLDSSSSVDFGNPGFLKQYALIFAASTILTVMLWLIAVAKRAVRGESFTKAFTEAIGLLLLQVVVSAFTPAALALVMQLVDKVSEVFAGNAVIEGKKFIDHVTKAISATGSNAPSVMIIIFLLLIVAGLLVWIELLVRSGALYVGAALGPLVNSGLVDRDLWGRTKRWMGMLFALALAKPVLFALFGLAAAIINSGNSSSDAVTTVLVGALMLFLAVFSSATLYKWLPSMGDDMAHMMHARKAASQSGPVASIPGPAQTASSAMSARMSRSVIGGGGGGTSAAAGPVAAGAAVAKAGADAVKHKIDDSSAIPDQGTGNGGLEGGGGSGPGDQPQDGGGGAPSTIQASSPGGPSVLPGGDGSGSNLPSAGEQVGVGPNSPTSPSVVPSGTPGGVPRQGTPSSVTGSSTVPASEGSQPSASSPASASRGTSSPAGSSALPSAGSSPAYTVQAAQPVIQQGSDQ